MSTVRIEYCPDCGQMVGEGMLYEHQRKYCKTQQDLACPFCREGDFDAIGLKHHLVSGHCDAYESVARVGEGQ